jgi:hypothetical protein
MLYGSMDPNERFRARRAQTRRRRRRRRAALLGVPLLAVVVLAAGWQLRSARGHEGDHPTAKAAAPVAALSAPMRPRPLPVEIRGVHVTGPLASLNGKLASYAALEKEGLNTIELDVKDESGDVAFAPSSVPLVRAVGAAREYYNPRAVARMLHARGIYLIGRVVVFQDPPLAAARPELAVHRGNGSVWTTSAGLAWVDPYDRRVWAYDVGIAAAAARAGFDEIMFDYVRFPSDGNLGDTVYPARTAESRGRVIADFAAYAAKWLTPLGARVSTAVFGLAATRDLRIGQVPHWISQHVDTVDPMAYPALYGSGELGIESPSAEPGETMFRTLLDFRRQLRGTNAHLVPWIQDWGYSLQQVQAQIDAARLQGAKGYLLWNAEGVYTHGALEPASASAG